MCSSRCRVACSTSATAWSKAAWFACEGRVDPLILRTYWTAAACTSSRVAGGSKLWRVLMLRHMPRAYDASGVVLGPDQNHPFAHERHPTVVEGQRALLPPACSPKRIGRHA